MADVAPSPFCPYTRTSTGYDRDTDERVLLAIGCRRWTCSICGPRRKAQLVRRIVAARPNRMVTLTCRHEDGPAHRHRLMVLALPRLITELRQVTPIEYLRMLESCVDGYPHFHLLVRSGFIEQSTIKEKWRRLTGAEIVDVRRAHGGSVAYVAKYINKARDETGTFSRQRISVSKDFWRPEVGAELAVTEVTREHPVPYATTKLSDRAITRRTSTIYQLDMREPGDEWPPEFTPNVAACENREASTASGQSAEGLSTTPSTDRPAADRESFAIPAS